MTVTTIDRVDHTSEQAIARVAAPIATIVAQLNAEGVPNALPASMSLDDVAALIRQIGERGAMLVCEQDGAVAGFATVRPDAEDATIAIMGVWVAPAHRRKGLGTELARSGAEFARDKGYAKLRGTIPSTNEPALSFFSSVGPLVQLEAGAMGYELPV